MSAVLLISVLVCQYRALSLVWNVQEELRRFGWKLWLQSRDLLRIQSLSPGLRNL